MSVQTRHLYRPLKDGAIRVFRFAPGSTADDIRGTLSVLQDYDQDHVTPYNALSYCWGDSNHKKTITVDGHIVTVTANLRSALSALSSIPETYYWIDALCINQHDVQERNAQVAQMWQIFASAKVVISWLGPKDENTDLIFDAALSVQRKLLMADAAGERGVPPRLALDADPLVYLCHSGDPTEPIANYEMSTAWGIPLMELCCREYFGRCWIIPEVLQKMAGSIVQCGDRSVDWITFQAIVIQAHGFWGRLNKHFAKVIHENQSMLQAVKICETRDMLEAWGDHPDPVEVFYDVLDFYNFSECTDVRDHIFAFINDPRIRRLRLQGFLRADYALTVKEISLLVLAEMTSLILARDGLPGQPYDVAVMRVACCLRLDLNSQVYYDWLKPQITKVYETRRTAADNAVYMIKLKQGQSIYLDTFQLRKIRKDPQFAHLITSPPDPWKDIPEFNGVVHLKDIGDDAVVVPLRNEHHGYAIMIADSADQRT